MLEYALHTVIYITMIDFDSSDMDRWADLPDAHHRFPELIRRLVFATGSNPSQLDFPERQFSAVCQAGTVWLRLRKGNAWVPAGASAWELRLRKQSLLNGQGYLRITRSERRNPWAWILLPPLLSLPHPESGRAKEDGVRERCKEGRWSNVRAFNADDLVAWLEQAPDGLNMVRSPDWETPRRPTKIFFRS